MTIITTTSLPPEIMQSFSSILLSDYDRWKILQEQISRLRKQVEKRYVRLSRREKEFEDLVKVFEVLYEWKKAKETYDKAENDEQKKRPDNPIDKFAYMFGKLGKLLGYVFRKTSYNFM